jgi:hypothetical protein
MPRFRKGDRVIAADMDRPAVVVATDGPGRVLIVDDWGFRRRADEDTLEPAPEAAPSMPAAPIP